MFYTQDLRDVVTVYIKLNTHQRRKISGFPQSLMWFIRQQQLDTKFDLPDHGIPGALRCCVCEGSQRAIGELMQKRKLDKTMQTCCKKWRLLVSVDA